MSFVTNRSCQAMHPGWSSIVLSNKNGRVSFKKKNKKRTRILFFFFGSLFLVVCVCVFLFRPMMCPLILFYPSLTRVPFDTFNIIFCFFKYYCSFFWLQMLLGACTEHLVHDPTFQRIEFVDCHEYCKKSSCGRSFVCVWVDDWLVYGVVETS